MTKCQWELWVNALAKRCREDWRLGKKMLNWKRLGKQRFLGPKLRKEYNRRWAYHWSTELIEDVARELVKLDLPVTSTLMAKKMNVAWITLHKKMKQFGYRIEGSRKPLNLYGTPPKMPIYHGRYNGCVDDGW